MTLKPRPKRRGETGPAGARGRDGRTPACRGTARTAPPARPGRPVPLRKAQARAAEAQRGACSDPRFRLSPPPRPPFPGHDLRCRRSELCHGTQRPHEARPTARQHFTLAGGRAKAGRGAGGRVGGDEPRRGPGETGPRTPCGGDGNGPTARGTVAGLASVESGRPAAQRPRPCVRVQEEGQRVPTRSAPAHTRTLPAARARDGQDAEPRGSTSRPMDPRPWHGLIHTWPQKRHGSGEPWRRDAGQKTLVAEDHVLDDSIRMKWLK